MNVKTLKTLVRDIKAKDLMDTIEDIDYRILQNANRGLSELKITTDQHSLSLYSITEHKVKHIKEYYEKQGFKVEINTVKCLTDWIDKLLGVYEPNKIITISWEI